MDYTIYYYLFEEIPKQTPYKTTALRPLTHHLKSRPNKTNKTNAIHLKKQERTY